MVLRDARFFIRFWCYGMRGTELEYGATRRRTAECCAVAPLAVLCCDASDRMCNAYEMMCYTSDMVCDASDRMCDAPSMPLCARQAILCAR
eukprot:949713-Rhodomonas_salina.1